MIELLEAFKTLKSNSYPASKEEYVVASKHLNILLDFVSDFLNHRVPLRVSPHQLGEFAKEWIIQDINGRTMLPNTPDCGNVHKLFRDMNEDMPNFYWSYNPKMNEEEIK